MTGIIIEKLDRCRKKLDHYWKQNLKLEHELKEKTELAARLMEEAEKWKMAAGALSLATLEIEGREASYCLDRCLESDGWNNELTREACMEEAEDIQSILDNYPRGSQ